MHKSLNLLIIAMLLGLAFSSSAGAAGDVERGKVLADTCLGCHGIPGYRNAYPSYRVPKLGGQHPEYLAIALEGYRKQTRAHRTMQAQAATLSDQDVQDLIAFFASEGELQTGEPVTGGKVAAGKEKAAVCTACHGETGASAAPNWPNLAGQHRDYLVHALTAYQNGERKDPVMMGQAASLTSQDIEDIAAYFAAQPGLFTVHYSD